MLLRFTAALLAGTLGAVPADSTLLAIEKKRAEFHRLTGLMYRLQVIVPELRREILADVEKAGCKIDAELSKVECAK
jgi:hypothetical protein